MPGSMAPKFTSLRKNAAQAAELEEISGAAEADSPPDTAANTTVLRGYRIPIFKRHIGGKRLSCYAMLLMMLGLASLALSYAVPWVFTGKEKPFEPELRINFSLLRRFPFTNIMLPEDGARVTEPFIQLSGTVKPGIELYINDERLAYDAQGIFLTEYALTEGENVIILEARLGAKKKATRRVVYYEPATDTQSAGDSADNTTDTGSQFGADEDPRLVLAVNIWPESTWLEVTIDGETRGRKTYAQGSSPSWSAKQSITIKAGNGASVFAKLNGEEMGLLSETAGEATREFTLASLQEE